MSYSTATVVGEILQTTFDGTSNPSNVEVNSFISRADEYINRRTKKKWGSYTARNEYQDGDGTNKVFLDNYPIVTVATFSENTAGIGSSPNWTDRSEGWGNDFVIYKKEGYLLFHDNVPDDDYMNCRITYTYGVATTPSDIEDLSATLAAITVLKAQKKYASKEDLIKFKVGSVEYTYDKTNEFIKRFEEKAKDMFDAIGVFSKVEVF